MSAIVEYTRTLIVKYKTSEGQLRHYKYTRYSKTGRTFQSVVPEERQIEIAAYGEEHGAKKAADKFGVTAKTVRKYIRKYYNQ